MSELTFCPDGPGSPTGPLGPGGPVIQIETLIYYYHHSFYMYNVTAGSIAFTNP